MPRSNRLSSIYLLSIVVVIIEIKKKRFLILISNVDLDGENVALVSKRYCNS